MSIHDPLGPQPDPGEPAPLPGGPPEPVTPLIPDPDPDPAPEPEPIDGPLVEPVRASRDL